VELLDEDAFEEEPAEELDALDVELVLDEDRAEVDESAGVAWLELLDDTIGCDTLVGSVMPTQPAARAAGALTSSSRKLRRAVSSW